MAVGDVISGATGTGTAADPYKPTTFLAWRTAVGTNNAYVCMEQDIDVSKDSVYKTGLTEGLAIMCSALYGTAQTYDNTVTYNTGDKCTLNDGEHGLCTYTCRSDGVTGVDVSDTTYWTRGGDPTKKLTGLIITSQWFMRILNTPQIWCNVFFESCVFDCSGTGFIYGDSSTTRLTINDCKFSLFYNHHTTAWNFVAGNIYPKFNRCSIYIRYSHGGLNSINSNKFASNSSTEFNNCTVNLIGFGCVGDNGMNPCLGKPTNSSFIINLDFRADASGNGMFTISATSCFFAISFGEIVGSYASQTTIKPYQMYGVNIIDKDVAGNIPISSNANTVQGTTAQCKDKDWLISQGFFAS